MSVIIPFHRSAVISRRFTRSGRTLSAAAAPRFSAAKLAEVESRYAQLLAADPAGGLEVSEPTTTTLGTPNMDQVEIETAIAMCGTAGTRRFLLDLSLGCEVVELTPAKARQAAAALRAVADQLVTLAQDADALTAIETGR